MTLQQRSWPGEALVDDGDEKRRMEEEDANGLVIDSVIAADCSLRFGVKNREN